MGGHEVSEDHPRALQDHPDLETEERLHVTKEVLKSPTLVPLNIELQLKSKS